MARNTRRDKGMGSVYQKRDKWEGAIVIGQYANGSQKKKYFSGKTKSEVQKK